MKLSTATEILSTAGIESARHDARELFIRFGGLRREDILGRDPDISTPKLEEAIERRKTREPLQYIVGECAFYNEIYKVSPDCLIPRSDTEILVDYAVKNIPCGKEILDLCTGSGCIAISTLKNTDKTRARALDISEGAIGIAKENAEVNGVAERIEFSVGDALQKRIEGDFYAILSNPPYVTEAAYSTLMPEIYFEPENAFLGIGEDGLGFYSRICELYSDSLPQGGFIGFEIGYDQGRGIEAIAKRHSLECEIIKDYSGNERVAILRREH